MIVVSNTSPLISLAAIKQFELLHTLFDQVHIAEAVWEELSKGDLMRPGHNEVKDAAWIQRHEVHSRSLVAILERDLDRGESETIALATELGADLVLIDEREGRRAGERLGFKVAGIVGLLLEAKERGFVNSVRPLLDSLRNTAGFYLGESVFRKALELAQESQE